MDGAIEIGAKYEWESNLIGDGRKVKWGEALGKGWRGYDLRLNTERQVTCFIYNDCREKGGEAELKRKW
jgi:hypothetical protein